MAPSRSQPPRFANTQPRTYSVGLKALLSLPFRLCNPPPAIGKVRSCGVTPLIKVRLEDVLNREHLPPLGLKDFEEWLLYVEMSPENLYFILWLRDYKQRYAQWQSQTAFQSRAASSIVFDESAHYSSHLAMFYARAKQTFFTPGSAYELNLASTLLAPFHRPNAPPYPPPEAFREVEVDTYRTLDESLRRFVHAQLNNVGNRRVLCGMIAGVVFCLIGGVMPLAVLFAQHGSRWARLAAFPGLWLGLSVLLASIHGVCLGVYIFGDLRQLRAFELARPPISKPQLLPAYRPILQTAAAGGLAQHASRAPSVSSLATRDTAFSGTGSDETDDNIHISPAYYDADSIEDIDPMGLYAPNPGSMQELPGSHYHLGGDRHEEREHDADVHAGKNNDSAIDLSTHSINMQPRIVPPSSINTAPNDAAPSYPLSVTIGGGGAAELVPASPAPSTTSTRYTATATFIYPFDAGLTLAAVGVEDEEEVLARAVHLPARHQVVAPFDFEGLPVHPGPHKGRAATMSTFGNSLLPPSQVLPGYLHPSHHQQHHTYAHPSIPRPPEPAHASSQRGLRGMLARMQERTCGLARWRLQTGYLEDPARSAHGNSGWGHASSDRMKEKDTRDSAAPHWSSPFWAQTRGATAAAASAPAPARQSSESEKTHTGDVRTLSEKGSAHVKYKEEEGRGRQRTLWKRLRAMRSVPAFAVPLARVLSPVVVRGQWEIVVRSGFLALVIAVAVVGGLLAVPVV